MAAPAGRREPVMRCRGTNAPPITPTMGVLLLLFNLALVTPHGGTGGSSPERGRDPWVFRLALEDKPAMLVAALSSEMWVAYNPSTAGLERVWTGSIDFKGKVWDFSQSNSDAEGRLLYDDAGTILSAVTPGTDLPAGWDADGVEIVEEAFLFTSDGSSLVSPRLDLSSVRNAMLSFNERSRSGPFLVDVSVDDGATWGAQAFESTLHGSQQDEYQRNIRQLEVSSDRVRVRFVQTEASHAKRLRAIQVTADQAVWDASDVRWLGYAFEPASPDDGRLVVRSELRGADGSRVLVTESPEVILDEAGLVLERRFVLDGGARLSLARSGAGFDSISGGCDVIVGEDRISLTFPSAGSYTLRQRWSR